MILHTVGYEGANFADFVASLIASEVTLVIDVRDVPISRKPGFSRRTLEQSLELRGISYLHLKGLGDPKAGRLAARRGDHAKFNAIYARHLKTVDARQALAIAAQSVREQVSCLLCFERSFRNCHRSIVADLLSRTVGVGVNHLSVQAGAVDNSRIGPARRGRDELRIGQS